MDTVTNVGLKSTLRRKSLGIISNVPSSRRREGGLVSHALILLARSGEVRSHYRRPPSVLESVGGRVVESDGS